ncbi:hypothetical protein JOD63_003177 [Microbacterium terrae]|uniref:Uncharacterized protein n=1 Tax=Microbacterium terrae TaxID=69369 RepID=A0A0M2H7W1_9MICO|nr:hypothetical protein [Microbacterium terrae]KJL40066.1 hypothetical protein RS81_01655 [Microbacterium terrae]MBP1079209.1 hypothetical protein [Microbacterium terrae]GLJ98609.1 hypothetical protein GCM10017594_18060 [Microbacterium terrae]
MHEHVENLLEAIARLFSVNRVIDAPRSRHMGDGHRIRTEGAAMNTRITPRTSRTTRKPSLAGIPRHLRPRRVRTTFVAPEQILEAI